MRKSYYEPSLLSNDHKNCAFMTAAFVACLSDANEVTQFGIPLARAFRRSAQVSYHHFVFTSYMMRSRKGWSLSCGLPDSISPVLSNIVFKSNLYSIAFAGVIYGIRIWKAKSMVEGVHTCYSKSRQKYCMRLDCSFTTAKRGCVAFVHQIDKRWNLQQKSSSVPFV